jgi:quinol monooxygenase YgiN
MVQKVGDRRYWEQWAKDVALIADQNADEIPGAGWSKDFLKQYSSDFPGSRSFVLDSTLLVGKPYLNATSSSYIEIEHVDSDPTKREAAKPLFEQLDREIRKQPGFKDLQVWTWNARTNHWTVIEVWESEAASRNAARQPGLIRIWDQLYGNAAAPNSHGEFRLMETAP